MIQIGYVKLRNFFFVFFVGNQNNQQKDSQANVPAMFVCTEMLEELQPKKTSMGCTIDQVIIDDQQGKVADLIAGDQETYSLFSDVFEPVIAAENPGYKACTTRYPFSFDPAKLSESHIADKAFIDSIHFMVARSIKEYRFLPRMNVEEKLEMEEALTTVFDGLPCGLRGSYKSLSEEMLKLCEGALAPMNTVPGQESGGPVFKPALEAQPVDGDPLCQVLPDDLHEKPDCGYYERAGIHRDWPAGRGIFTNKSGSTKITVNRDDHLRIYHEEQGGDLEKAFGSLCKVYRAVQRGLSQKNLHFAYDSKYGFVNWSPSMIGNSMIVAVKIRLPLLQKHERFQTLLSECSLRCDRVEQNSDGADILQLSLKNIYGSHEVDLIDTLGYGLRRLIKIEKMLRKGECSPYEMPSDYSHNKCIERNEYGGRKCARLRNMIV